MPITRNPVNVPSISYPASDIASSGGSLWEDVSTEFESRSVALMVYGDTDCISKDTHLNYQVRDVDGRVQNSKGGSIETLYKRLHKIPQHKKGGYQRPETINSTFHIASVMSDGSLGINKIENVLSSGIKTTYKVVTKSYNWIKTTLEHKFMIEDGSFQTLGDLSIGDKVLVSPGIAKSTINKVRPYRPEITVLYHSQQRRARLRGGNVRYRILVSHASYEAHKNGMTYSQYIEILNSGDKSTIDQLWSIPEGVDIHHLDENPTNNDPGNLILVGSRSQHIKEFHIESCIKKLNIYVEPDEIVSITKEGEEETYDLVCADPYRNFIAHRFAVHNSGRSTFALTAPGPIAYIHGYEKVAGVINEAAKTKLIRECKFGGDLRGTPDRIQELAEAQVRKMEAAISDAYSWARTIIVDTESKAWEIHQLAKLGSLERADNALSEKEKKKGQLIYQGINNRWSSMLGEYRVRAENPLQSQPANLILICKTVDEYEGNKATGRTIFKCQKDTPFFCDVRIRTRIKINQFSLTVEKPWWNAEMRGFELTGGKDLLTFPMIMSLITQTDQENWK